MSEYELYHYGVLGMKWGVRRDKRKAYARSIDHRKYLDERAGKKQDKSTASAKKLAAKIKKAQDLVFKADILDAKMKQQERKYNQLDDTDRLSSNHAKNDKKFDRWDKQSDRMNKQAEKLQKQYNKAMVQVRDQARRTKYDQNSADYAVYKYERFAKAMAKTFETPIVNMTNRESINEAADYVNNLIKRADEINKNNDSSYYQRTRTNKSKR